MKIFIETDYTALSKKAADVFAEELIRFPAGAFGFATGGTPVGMYDELKLKYSGGSINFSKISAYNLDEYYPINGNDPQSYKYFMASNLFDAVNLPLQNRFIPNGEAANPEEECTAYDEMIKNSGGIKMQILGIGNNGHIGFNEPDNYFTNTTSYVALDENTINSNARFFDKPEDVPRFALTIGIRTIFMADKILLLASGEGKAKILKAALYGKITPEVPASVLQLHRDVTIVADKAAAKYL